MEDLGMKKAPKHAHETTDRHKRGPALTGNRNDAAGAREGHRRNPTTGTRAEATATPPETRPRCRRPRRGWN